MSKKQRTPRKKSHGISSISMPRAIPAQSKKPEQSKITLNQEKPQELPKIQSSLAQPEATTVTITLTQPKTAKNPSLRSVNGTLTFKLADGQELSNLLELAHALEKMADKTFLHHATIEHNDFSNWIKHVFELDSLADSIKSTPKIETGAKIYRHLLQEMMK